MTWRIEYSLLKPEALHQKCNKLFATEFRAMIEAFNRDLASTQEPICLKRSGFMRIPFVGVVFDS